ncbi:MAG: VanZ family protein [Bacteroidota bacterium]
MPDIEVPFLDKAGHVGLFAFLVLLWTMYIWVQTNGRLHRLGWVALCAFIYGIVIEALQELFFEPRTADIWDVVANFVGIALGGLIFYVLRKIIIR